MVIGFTENVLHVTSYFMFKRSPGVNIVIEHEIINVRRRSDAVLKCAKVL